MTIPHISWMAKFDGHYEAAGTLLYKVSMPRMYLCHQQCDFNDASA